MLSAHIVKCSVMFITCGRWHKSEAMKCSVDCRTCRGWHAQTENSNNVRAQEHERYYPTPPHPTGIWSWKSSAVPVSAGQQERWWGCCACVCTGTWTLLPHPTPPVTDHERAVQCLCLQDSKKDDEVAVPDPMSQPRVPKCYPKGLIPPCWL